MGKDSHRETSLSQLSRITQLAFNIPHNRIHPSKDSISQLQLPISLAIIFQLPLLYRTHSQLELQVKQAVVLLEQDEEAERNNLHKMIHCINVTFVIVDIHVRIILYLFAHESVT